MKENFNSTEFLKLGTNTVFARIYLKKKLIIMVLLHYSKQVLHKCYHTFTSQENPVVEYYCPWFYKKLEKRLQ